MMKTILADQHLEQLLNELPPGGSINLPVPEAMALQKYARYIKGIRLIRFPIDDHNRKLLRPVVSRHISDYTEDEFLGDWPKSGFTSGRASHIYPFWRGMSSDPALKECSLTTFTRRLCDFAEISMGEGRVSIISNSGVSHKEFKILSREAFEQLFVEGEQMPDEAEAATQVRTDARTS